MSCGKMYKCLCLTNQEHSSYISLVPGQSEITNGDPAGHFRGRSSSLGN